MTAAIAGWRSKGSCDGFHSRNLGPSACFGRRLNTIQRRNQMKTKTKVKAGQRSAGINHNESQVRDKAPGLKIRTNVKAGALTHNHNESQVRDKAPGLKVQTNVKAGSLTHNHNKAQVRDAAAGFRVQTNVKAGGCTPDDGSGAR